MGIENAILEHAAALRELAAAILDSAAAQRESNTGYRDAVVAYAMASGGAPIAAKVDTAIVTPDADLDRAVAKVEQDAKDKAAKDKALAKAKKDAEEKAAAEAAASNEKPDTNGADSSDDDGDAGGLGEVLDYKADVRPILLDAIKRTSKEKVQALVKSYGVEKAEQIDPAYFADVVAKANALGL